MDKETLEKIFEPFFTTKPPDKGTGLGLSISRRLAGILQGKITVSSEKGKGSIFRLYLPLQISSSQG
jgi:signal transduction histidine kinase